MRYIVVCTLMVAGAALAQNVPEREPSEVLLDEGTRLFTEEADYVGAFVGSEQPLGAGCVSAGGGGGGPSPHEAPSILSLDDHPINHDCR